MIKNFSVDDTKPRNLAVKDIKPVNNRVNEAKPRNVSAQVDLIDQLFTVIIGAGMATGIPGQTYPEAITVQSPKTA